MAKKNNTALLKKLKKQVRVLQRKEEQGRNKLQLALKKARKLSRSYKVKLRGKIRSMKGKIAEAQSSTYGKLAADVERQLIKGIEKKARSLAAVFSRIEKKQAARLAKGLSKKGKIKKSKKGKKSKKTASKAKKRR